MKQLITLAKQCLNTQLNQPYSVYSSVAEQRLTNVPITKPLLIFVLGGEKKLGESGQFACPAGSFVFLSNNPNTYMRNIPKDDDYFAVLIEFNYADFYQFKDHPTTEPQRQYFKGEINPLLHTALQQFIELSVLVPADSLTQRKQELLHLIYLSGHKAVCSIAEPPSFSHRVHDLVSSEISQDWSTKTIAKHLHMSDSTVTRKLRAEGSTIKIIKNKARLGLGLHLIQTSFDDIGNIATQCGYQSQSRFTKQFKTLFGMTPTELRKTRVKPSHTD